MTVDRAEDSQGQSGGTLASGHPVASSSTGRGACTSNLVLSCCDPDNLFDTLARGKGLYNTVLITEKDDLRTAEGKTRR